MTSGSDEGWFLEFEGRRVDLREGEVTLGRSRGCGVVLRDPSVSRGHALLSVRQGRVTLQDLRSSNGSYVNGKRLDKETVLEEGDRVVIGETELFLRYASVRMAGAGPAAAGDAGAGDASGVSGFAGGRGPRRSGTGEVSLYCPACGLPIHGATTGRCPGCGADLAEAARRGESPDERSDRVETGPSRLAVPALVPKGSSPLAAVPMRDLLREDSLPSMPASFTEFARLRAVGAFDAPAEPAADEERGAGDRPTTAETKPWQASRDDDAPPSDLPMSLRELDAAPLSAPPPAPLPPEPPTAATDSPPVAGLWNRLAGYFRGPRAGR